MTIEESLKQINLYPIQPSSILNICERRGLDPEAEADKETRESREYRLAEADIYRWLSLAPNSVSQGGVTFSISDKDKQQFKNIADSLYDELSENKAVAVYGYKGDRL